MQEDGDIDYSRYSLKELREALNSIDAESYPINNKNLLAAIERTSPTSLDAAKEEMAQPAIPIGRHGFIEIPIARKYLWPVRAVMLAISIPFIVEAYETLITGVAEMRYSTLFRDEHWGYYAHLLKHSTLAFFFLWMGSLGLRAKPEQRN